MGQLQTLGRRLGASYLIALCLLMTLSDANDKKRKQWKRATYANPERERPISTTEKHILENADYYFKAFSEPSSEYLGAYLRVLFVLALVGYGTWVFFLRRQQNVIKVSFKDVDYKCEVEDSPKEEGGEAKKVKKNEKKERRESSKKRDTTATTAVETPTAEYRSMSLKREYIKKGPFDLTDDGLMMKMESFAKAMAIMSKHIWIKYSINRKEIIENRYGLY